MSHGPSAKSFCQRRASSGIAQGQGALLLRHCLGNAHVYSSLITILLACPAGLALYRGLIYAAFGSHCDRPPYWPWIFAFEAKTLKISSFWTTPSFICNTSLCS